MIYSNIQKATFISRPNRFVAHVELGGQAEICHVKNTGRCKELLAPGAQVYVQAREGPSRKTKYDLISVLKGSRLINIDSQAPNRVFAEWAASGGFLPGILSITPECRFGNSRFDFLIRTRGREIFVEVKGVTLEENGVVLFPDAPTERGLKHISELMACRRQGFGACLVFIVQMRDVRYFTPNAGTHPAFADKLREAAGQGVTVLALDCDVTENAITPGVPVEIRL